VEAASQQACCGHSATAGRGIEPQILRQGRRVLSAAWDTEDLLREFSAPFQDGPRSRASSVELSDHSVLVCPQCIQPVPANNSNK